MALAVFPFARSVRPRCAEWPTFATRSAKFTGGNQERSADFGSDFVLRAIFSLEFPQRSTGKTIADFLAWIESTRGGALPFAYSAYTDRYREARAAALGTGDGVTTVFPLLHKYVDATTLVVKSGGVAVAGAAYVFSGNEVAPIVTFVAPPAGAAVLTYDADFRVPMHFENGDSLEPVVRAAIPTDAKRSVRIDGIALVEAQPGARLVRAAS